MQRQCPKCLPNHGVMMGETREIPRKVPLAITLNPTTDYL